MWFLCTTSLLFSIEHFCLKIILLCLHFNLHYLSLIYYYYLWTKKKRFRKKNFVNLVLFDFSFGNNYRVAGNNMLIKNEIMYYQIFEINFSLQLILNSKKNHFSWMSGLMSKTRIYKITVLGKTRKMRLDWYIIWAVFTLFVCMGHWKTKLYSKCIRWRGSLWTSLKYDDTESHNVMRLLFWYWFEQRSALI